jgi:hypothetical protein
LGASAYRRCPSAPRKCRQPWRGCGCVLTREWWSCGRRQDGAGERLRASSRQTRRSLVLLKASGCAAVFVDQATQNVDPLDVLPRDDRAVVHGCCRYRDVQAEAPVRSSGVVVRQVRGQHPVQVPVVPDQNPVQTFGPYGAYPAFRVGVRSRGPRRDFQDLHARRGEHVIEGLSELRVPVADQEPEPAGTIAGSDRGALPGSRPVGFPGPPFAPAVRLSPQRALHMSYQLVSR